MKRACVLLTFLLCCCTTALAQGPIVSMSVSTDNDHQIISVFNSHNLPIEAFVVSVDDSGKGDHLNRIYFDTHAAYRNDKPIVSGTSNQRPLPHLVGAPLPVTALRAVIFADGTTLGQESWVNELLHRRTILADGLRELMALLQKASDDKVTKDQAIASLQQARKARELTATAAGVTIWEQAIQDLPFSIAISTLDPPLEVDANVREVSARIRAVNRFFAAWLADLQEAKPSGAAMASAN